MSKCLNVILCNEEKKTQTNKALGRSHQHLCRITSVTDTSPLRNSQLWTWTSAPPWPWILQDVIMSPKSKPQKNLPIMVHFGKGQNRLLKYIVNERNTKQLTYRSQLVATLGMTLEGEGIFRGMATVFLKLDELFSFWIVCLCAFVYMLYLNKSF